MSLIVLYFLHSTSVLSFHIDVVLTLSINVVLRLYNYYIFHCLVYLICILCTALEKIAVRRYENQ